MRIKRRSPLFLLSDKRQPSYSVNICFLKTIFHMSQICIQRETTQITKDPIDGAILRIVISRLSYSLALTQIVLRVRIPLVSPTPQVDLMREETIVFRDLRHRSRALCSPRNSNMGLRRPVEINECARAPQLCI